MTKECNRCGKSKPLDKFRRRIKKERERDGINDYYIMGECRACEKEKREKYYWGNRDIMLKRMIDNRKKNGHKYEAREKRYRKENYPKIKKYMTKYRADNKEYLAMMHKPRAKAWHDKNRDELSDIYVIYKIIQRTGLKRADIEPYPELIEVYRQNIMLKRKINES